MPPAPPQPPAARFARVIAMLCEAVAARRGWLAGPLIILIWTRLRRMAVRMDRIAARAATGPLPPPRKRPAMPRRSPARPCQRLPQGRAWLVRLVPAAASGAGQLQALLDDPAMQALIADAPQIGRTLRPLCRMLGVGLPPALRRPSPAVTVPPRPAQAGRRPAPGPARAAPRRSPPTPRAPEVARPARAPPVPA